MGAVHGVHLKYVAMSAASGVGAWYAAAAAAEEVGELASINHSFSRALPFLLWYCSAVHLLISILFVARSGTWIIGKSASTGQAAPRQIMACFPEHVLVLSPYSPLSPLPLYQVPLWSLLLWAPFHAPTWLYTAVHTWLGKLHGIPVANEVAPGWWIGGRLASRPPLPLPPPFLALHNAHMCPSFAVKFYPDLVVSVLLACS